MNKNLINFLSTVTFLTVILIIINLVLWIPLNYFQEPKNLLESLIKISIAIFMGFMNVSLLTVIILISKDEYSYYKYYKNEKKTRIRKGRSNK